MRNDYIIRKLYVSFMVVSILSALAATAGMLIDNIVVGRCLGSVELGAMGIVGPISLVFSAFGNIVSGGGTARASQALGKGDRKQMSRIFTVSMLYVLAAGVILTVLGLAFAPQIATVLGAQEELFRPSTDYLRGYFLGALPTLMTTALMGFVKIDGSPRLPLLCIVTMSACNIVLDLLMAMVFKLGMFGMALATSISYALAALVSLTHFLKKQSTLRLIAPTQIGKELLALIATGAPNAVNRICSTATTMILNNLLVVCVGVGAVTALNIRTTANNFFGALIMGLAQASVPIIAMFYGEESKSALRDTLKTALKIGLASTALVGGVVVLCAPAFVGLLGVKDSDLSQMAITAVRLYGMSMPFALINLMMMSCYQSMCRTGMATLICVLEALVFTVTFSFALVGWLEAFGVWLAFLLAEVLTVMSILFVTLVKNKAIPKSLDDFLRLKNGFGGEVDQQLDISIGNSMDEVMRISQGIYRFGKGRDIPLETLNQLSLAIEEMVGNVVQHAFRPGEKRWLDLMVLNKPETIIVRIRDNGAEFSPVDYVKSVPKEAFGIRLVAGMAETMEYRRMLGLNTVLITLKK